ncbi:MAG: M48 family metallopeptidase [Vicinamibacteria bacterium]|nr:M48 family metallopeptidase [Vicinamibacteria bacterium]
MTIIAGVLHDPESGKSRRAEARIADGRLSVDAESGPQQATLGAVEITTGGWQAQAVHLGWRDGAGRTWAFTVEDPAARAALAAALPPALAAKVAASHGAERRVQRSGRLALALLGAFFTLPLVLLALLFAFREPLLDWVVARLPTSVDARLGQLTAEQVKATGKLVETGPAVDAVKAIGDRLLAHAPAHPHEFRFAVMEDPSLNAFAAPGGFVVVHTGLIAAADGPEEVAGVLGHEIAHVLRRHSLRQMAFELGLTALVQLAVGSADGAVAILTGTAQQLSGLSFSRDQESEADRLGLDLLQAARLPGEGLPRFFDRLAKEGGNAVPAFLSSHPQSDERREALAAELARRGEWATDPLALEWSAVRDSVAAKN